MSHFLLMSIYAALVGAFFALLLRREPRGQVKLFLQIFLPMIGLALVVGWLMFFFPSGPPSPIP